MVHPGAEAPNIPCCGVDWCIYAAAAALLLVFAAIFSGLTIALMAIDPMQLAVIRASGTDSERPRAKRVHDRCEAISMQWPSRPLESDELQPGPSAGPAVPKAAASTPRVHLDAATQPGAGVAADVTQCGPANCVRTCSFRGWRALAHQH